jgi:hypothetical protein
MVALLVFLVVLVNAVVVALLFFVALVRLVFRLQPAFLLVLALGAEAGLGLAHLVELLAVALVVLEDFVLLVLLVLVLELLNNGVRLLLAF